jgi:hypothetical protein
VTEILDAAAPPDERSDYGQGLALLTGSAVLAAATATLLIDRSRMLAGFSAAGSASLLLAASIRWGLEGGRRSRFAYLVLDLAFDTAVLAPIAWIARLPSPRVATLALVGLGASYVASYERARGRSLGYAGSEGFLYRAVRAALLVFGLLTGWIEGSLWAFVVLTVVAVAVRAWSVAQQQRAWSEPSA